MGNYKEKFNLICDYLRSFDDIVVCFSGGVDSTLLAYAAYKSISLNKLKIVSFYTPFVSNYCRFWMKKIVSLYNWPWQVINVNFETISKNINFRSGLRCYQCKRFLMKILKEKYPSATILEGTNFSDNINQRPGWAALKELGINSPLYTLRITKEEIRLISQWLNLPGYERASQSCLLTRFSLGVKFRKKDLAFIEKGENLLRIKLGEERYFRLCKNNEGIYLKTFQKKIKLANNFETSLKKLNFK